MTAGFEDSGTHAEIGMLFPDRSGSQCLRSRIAWTSSPIRSSTRPIEP